jgi:hypothetical protein
LKTGLIYVRRLKESLSTHQPIEETELRAIRTWLREREKYSIWANFSSSVPLNYCAVYVWVFVFSQFLIQLAIEKIQATNPQKNPAIESF